MRGGGVGRRLVASLLAVGALGCSGGESPTTPVEGPPDPEAPAILVLPVVVHVVHRGEPVGVGTNLSDARVAAQIRILNEDFRRRPGTPGFNTHPDGADTGIEFVLAARTPGGQPTTGIRRIDATRVSNPVPENDLFRHFAHYGYWDPEEYVNVWTMPLPESARGVVLGFATGPETTLPGADLLLVGEPTQPEGILVNAAHFGPGAVASDFDRGRTLTHEMGHYLGLLHLWGGGVCAENDFVADTPASSTPIVSCAARIGCGGVPTQPRNYMTFAEDGCMNLFTQGQAARMRYVLDTSPHRRGLATSPALPTRLEG